MQDKNLKKTGLSKLKIKILNCSLVTIIQYAKFECSKLFSKANQCPSLGSID